MYLRDPLGWLFTLGALAWPIGLFGFGGFDETLGAIIIGAGSALLLGTVALEFLLRLRDKRRE